MPVKAVAPKTTKKVATTKSNLSAPLISLTGKAAGNLDLPEELFGAKINKALLSQAIRVYSTNMQGHWSNTKTRGEVAGSTRKIFKQKGTGRARHGAIKAPIFVGGGIALGPKSRITSLDLPKKMRKQALASALSQKQLDQEIMGLADAEKATGKTRDMAQFFKTLNKRSTLLVIDKSNESLFRSVKNLKDIDLLTADQLNAYEVIKHASLIFTREAVARLQDRGNKEEKGETK